MAFIHSKTKPRVITTQKIDHLVEHTDSCQLYKGILDDSSKGVFKGSIFVHKDAQLITSSQLNKNLLLSKKANIETMPQLEIYADDVKCSHGATIGQLSDEEAFYLQSRGISKDRAYKILSQAFSYDAILKIRTKKLRNTCKSLFKIYYRF